MNWPHSTLVHWVGSRHALSRGEPFKESYIPDLSGFNAELARKQVQTREGIRT